MIGDSPEERAAEFQGQRPLDPLTDPATMRREADKRVEAIRDRTSHGTPVSEHNREKHAVSSKPSMNVDGAPNGGQYVKMVDERSQFRKPEDIQKIEKGTGSRAEIRRLKHGTEFLHGNILVRRGGVVHEGGDSERYEATGNGLRGGNLGNRNDPISQSEFRDKLASLMPYAFPKGLASLLWELSGQSVHSGMIPILRNDGTAGGGQLQAEWMGGWGSGGWNIYVAGNKWTWADITGTQSRYIKVPIDGVTAPSFEVAMEDPMPRDAEYYDLYATFGDIHVTRT